jgi:hypothetical protein
MLTDEEIQRIGSLLVSREDPGDFKLACAILEGKRDGLLGSVFVEHKVTRHEVKSA